MKPPAEGWALENWASVLPSSATATPAAMMVSGEATPAVVARKPKPKKKLIAGPMLAMVALAMSTIPSVPPRSRRGSWASVGAGAGREPRSDMGDLLLRPGEHADAGGGFPGCLPEGAPAWGRMPADRMSAKLVQVDQICKGVVSAPCYTPGSGVSGRRG